MRPPNLSVLYRNVLDGLRTELGQDAFLWATEQRFNDRLCYAAERFAHEVEVLTAGLRPMLELAARAHEGCDVDDLERFLLRRHANWTAGGNVRPSYCDGDAA